MVEVFKTNVKERHEAEQVLQLLQERMPDGKATIDLSDCDKVLRIDAPQIDADCVIQVLASCHYQCEVMK
jgi:hypothetical protein